MNRLVLPVVVTVLLWSGSTLPAPPVDGFAAWVDHVGAVVAAAAVARLVALLAAGALLVLSVASAAAEAAGALRLAAGIERALPPVLRRVLVGVAGVGTVGSALVAGPLSGVPAAGDARRPVATMQVEGPESSDGDEVGEATMQVVDDTPAAPEAPAPDSRAAVDEWVVEPGDSFWAIAEEVVGERLGRLPSDTEVVGYWARLVEANRSELVTGDPDLIYPGQRFTLVA